MTLGKILFYNRIFLLIGKGNPFIINHSQSFNLAIGKMMLQNLNIINLNTGSKIIVKVIIQRRNLVVFHKLIQVLSCNLGNSSINFSHIIPLSKSILFVSYITDKDYIIKVDDCPLENYSSHFT